MFHWNKRCFGELRSHDIVCLAGNSAAPSGLTSCRHSRNSRHSMYLPPLSGKSHRPNLHALLLLLPGQLEAWASAVYPSFVLGPLFYFPPILACFTLLGFLNSAFLSFLMSLIRSMPALFWALIVDKVRKMSSVSLIIIQMIRLLWWSRLKGKVLSSLRL